MRSSSRRCGFLVVVSAAVLVCMLPLRAQNFQVLQPLADKPVRAAEIKLKSADFYVPATADTIRWGFLPNNESKPILTVPAGATVTFDTLSHEGILEDQGRDPEKFLAKFGIKPEQVLNDAKAIAKSGIAHDFVKDGPHVVIGPIAIEGAQPGDVFKVDMVSLLPRVPYGVISNRYGKGALPGVFSENAGPKACAGAGSPELTNNGF